MTRDQEFLQYIIEQIVDDKSAVKIERSMNERGVLLTLHVAKDDMGRVVGKNGQTISAVRVLVRIVGSQNEAVDEQRVAVKLEDERDKDDVVISAPAEAAEIPAPVVEEKAAPSEIVDPFDVQI